jgi:flagellar hook-associated protein 1 FlgK
LLNQATNGQPSLESNLNQLAQSFAAAVNSALQGGVDQSNSAPVQDLFSFDAVAGAAKTITTNALQPSELALADPLSPGGNAVAVNIVNLQTAGLVGGATLTQFYGNLAAQVGQSLSTARSDQATAESLTSQAQTLRSDLQGVSLDQEAINLLQFQRSYNAMSQFVKVINEMTQDLMGILR